MAAQKIAFIGLGQMGRHMASNLLKAGHSLIVCDASPAAVEAFTRAHPTASVAATPGAAAATPGATAVITMLPSSPHVRACYEEGGSRGIFGAARPGTLLVDCSTINPGVAASVGGAAAARGLAFVDAPVSGGVGGAEAGTLTFMVGGPAPAFAAAQPLLGAMGRNIVHVGGPGAGCAAKLCNNLVLGASMLAVAEAMQLGKRLGVDAHVLAGIINTSSGKCWSSEVRGCTHSARVRARTHAHFTAPPPNHQVYNPVPGVCPSAPASRDYAGGFAAALMLKDLNLALEAAHATGATLPATATASTWYSLATAATGKAAPPKDFSSVYEVLDGRAQ
jgi:3-hydroxyisobutyrate dehydrogenase